MTLFLSVPEFLSQQADTTSLIEAIRQPWTIPLKDTTGNSHGYRQEVNLSQGLNILIDNYTLRENLIVETGSCDSCIPELGLEMSFVLSGFNRHEGVQANWNFFNASWGDVDGGQFHWQAGERVLKFDIHIDLVYFETLVGKQMNTMPSLLKQLVQSSQPMQEKFWQVDVTTAPMRTAIHQILHCPYQGLTRWLYWESRVIELIALRLDQVSQQSQQSLPISLKPNDVERIYQAKDILLRQLDHPPSLLELARYVGLNDCTLKRGFREVFGTTAFGCLHDYRLEQARRLLQEHRLNVSEVARAVGFGSGSYLSKAFRKKYGVSPKQYQAQYKNSV